MATRPIAPQAARGEAVVGGAKRQQKKNGAEVRNRKALGDIGNTFSIKGIDGGKHNRPITRSFCAQLLANDQAAAVAEKNKKQVNANVVDEVAAGKREGGVAGGAPKAAQRKVTSKPKPKEVIEISPNTEEAEKSVHNKKDKQGNSKKNSRTLTSVLTARSKLASGVTNKPEVQIVDIDAADAGNELAAVEYVDDIYKFYKMAEDESRPRDYMESQPEVSERIRAILVDWLIDVHRKFELSSETLYLTINIIDRFLAVKAAVPRRELQLVGISAMLMASKYEEIWPPEVNDFVYLSDRAYTHQQILVMEKIILGKLEWTLTVPTPYVFLVRFIKASSILPDHELENMANFYAELGLMHYGAVVMYCPSMIAASAMLAARCTLSKNPAWNDTLKLHTGYAQEQLMDCARLLLSYHSMAGSSKLQVVNRKYSDAEKGGVALVSPAKALLLPLPSINQ